MSVLADALNTVLVLADGSGDTGGEKIALYGMIGGLGAAFLTFCGVALSAFLGRRPQPVAADTDRLDLLEDWIRICLGVDPDAITDVNQTLQELQHARPRPHA